MPSLTTSRNPYFELAGPYVLAKLNLMNGLPATQDVLKAVRWTERYFGKRKPRATSVKRAVAVKRIGLKNAKLRLIKQRTQRMQERAAVLAAYNRGEHLPGCSA